MNVTCVIEYNEGNVELEPNKWPSRLSNQCWLSVTLLPRLLRLNILGWTVVETVIQLSHSLWFCVTMLARYRWWVVPRFWPRGHVSRLVWISGRFLLNIHLFIQRFTAVVLWVLRPQSVLCQNSNQNLEINML